MMFKWIANMWKDEIIEQKSKFDLKKAKTDHINMVFGNCKHGVKLGMCLICCRDKKESNKMTREEAVRKVVKDKCYSDESAIRLVDSLKALGLIKFDEPEPSPIEKGLTQAIGTVGYEKLTNWCINHGYQILKKSVGNQQETSPSPYSIVSKNSAYPNQILAELEYWGYKIVKMDGTKA